MRLRMNRMLMEVRKSENNKLETLYRSRFARRYSDCADSSAHLSRHTFFDPKRSALRSFEFPLLRVSLKYRLIRHKDCRSSLPRFSADAVLDHPRGRFEGLSLRKRAGFYGPSGRSHRGASPNRREDRRKFRKRKHSVCSPSTTVT